LVWRETKLGRSLGRVNGVFGPGTVFLGFP